ncbi:uncharacterized protein N0V89_000029 [Didymosphaeria variabile]|uniref:Ubiquitin carrier protein n=1 Tax=Didymosphaeria variabile TaxID=1932322 RepID=A0A9W8XW15_9PLEO|nr:uncharacterized protein N0V89_000029 [Didymosphaeria variabile]KAJ4359475.1 hypothetical protein N0V89_000029 [Didymosphaeria variabile]
MIQHITRRTVQHAPAFIKRAQEDHPQLQMPTWGAAILIVTFIASMLAITLVQYTLTDVLPMLAMVETPAAAITVSNHDEPASKDEKEGLLETGTEITLVHQKPITSSIRATIRHLTAEAGKFARWRGFRYQMIYALALGWMTSLLEAFFPRFLPISTVFIAAIAGAATANLHAAWTHKVISTPSDVSFWSRIPSRKQWKALALPAAVAATMPYISLFLSMGFVSWFGLEREIRRNDFDAYNGGQWASFIFRWVAVVAISVCCTLFLCMPAVVTQIRVEASILPEDQDTIVPFDRTFGGKVVAKVLGGTGCVSFMDAWRSFNWEARRRLIKLYIKGFVCIAALAFVLVHVLAFEVFAIMGPEVGKFLAKAHKEGVQF